MADNSISLNEAYQRLLEEIIPMNKEQETANIKLSGTFKTLIAKLSTLNDGEPTKEEIRKAIQDAVCTSFRAFQ